MQSPEGKVHQLLEDTLKKDGVVHSVGIGCAIFENLVIKIQGSEERVREIA